MILSLRGYFGVRDQSTSNVLYHRTQIRSIPYSFVASFVGIVEEKGNRKRCGNDDYNRLLQIATSHSSAVLRAFDPAERR